MKLSIRIALFALLVLVQLAVPASMIVGREITLRRGQPYRFHTSPVDPYDPFRGRFVALQLDPRTAPRPEGVQLDHNQRAYAVLREDAEGFAQIETLSLTRPEGDNYMRVRVSSSDSPNRVTVRWPIDRYYMDERLAPEAERAYRKNSRREQRRAHVTVRVRAGKAALEELYIEGVPIVDFVEAQGTEDARQP